MQHPGDATQAGLELRPGRVSRSATGTAVPFALSSKRGASVEALALALVYLVSIASLAGFATFGLHPALLARSNVAPETYARILLIAPRAQILIAVAAIGLLLVRRAGARWMPAFVAVYVLSLAAELAGTTAGIPFGPYRYTDVLGVKWFGHVPALIPASWFMMALPSYAIAARLLGPSPATVRRVALGSFILLSWDLALDPAMSLVTKHWVWGTTGPYYGMPLLNLFGWFVTGVALMIVFALMRADGWIDRLPTGWLLAFYGANLLLPVGMSMAAGLWGVVIATGVALALVLILARGKISRGLV
jgi:uncharacterized membrane protein